MEIYVWWGINGVSQLHSGEVKGAAGRQDKLPMWRATHTRTLHPADEIQASLQPGPGGWQADERMRMCRCLSRDTCVWVLERMTAPMHFGADGNVQLPARVRQGNTRMLWGAAL
jgi:hypothetical protein